MLATFLVLALARGGATVRVLLTGVVVASACGALVTLVLVLADNGQLRGMMFWLAGDLGWAAQPWIMLAAALLATLRRDADRAAARRARDRRNHARRAWGSTCPAGAWSSSCSPACSPPAR